MCGIFGQFDPMGIREAQDLSGRLFAALKHRGPDDHGAAFFDPQGNPVEGEQMPALMLGQTRLSIIDLSSAGHQPMFSADGRYVLVYNGEIFNFGELRRKLESRGYSFRSNTDTEVLLYWLAEHGESRLTDLNGMFAFAFYDRKENTLLCVRDYFGIKPFYYSFDEGRFSFASEVPAMLEFGVSRELDPQTVYQYLVRGQYDFEDTTFRRAVKALLPGHFCKIDFKRPGAPDIRRYWKPDLSRKIDVSFDEAAQHIRELFLKQIELHLISDVPLGIALSGGIDSSAIACAVRHLYPDREIHTFSYIADDAKLSEESHIRTVEKAIGSIPHHTGIDIDTLRDRLPELVKAQGEPFGSTTNFALFAIFECARKNGITVTLEGQGADELLGGYTGYPDERLRTFWNRGELRELIHFLNAAPAICGRSRANLLRALIGNILPGGIRDRLYSRAKARQLQPRHLFFQPEFLKDVRCGYDPLQRRNEIFPCPDAMRQCLAYQLTSFGIPHLLRRGDRSSMNFSIESRVPFLTREMAEYCLSLPEEYLVTRDCLTKAVFRKAMRGIVPDAILDRRDKIGFATPEKQLFLGNPQWVKSWLDQANGIPYLNGKHILAYWEAVRSGSIPFDWSIWRLINFIAFLKNG